MPSTFCVEPDPPRDPSAAHKVIPFRRELSFAYVIAGVALLGAVGAGISAALGSGEGPGTAGAITSAVLLLIAAIIVFGGAEVLTRRRRIAYRDGVIAEGRVTSLFRRRRIHRSRPELFARVEFRLADGRAYATAVTARGWLLPPKDDEGQAGPRLLEKGDRVLVAFSEEAPAILPLLSRSVLVDVCEDRE